MSDDGEKDMVATAFERVAARILSASSSLSEGTLAAIRRSLDGLRSRIDGDPQWVRAVMADAKDSKQGTR